jgi:tetratricopeptide (TPR) repeat protein
VRAEELDQDVRQQDLRTLSVENAEWVARHLVMVARTLDEDPELSWRHAQAAVSRAGRVPAVREAAGLAAYRAGEYAKALTELRAARRMSGDDQYLPVIADSERGLGRAEKALTIAGSPEAAKLPLAGRIEMRIVAAGARLDLDQPEAALVTLQCAELNRDDKDWAPRLKYAYADALLAAGRRDDAIEWFAKAAAIDADGVTDAEERWTELLGVTVEFIDDDVDEVAADAAPTTSTATRNADVPAAADGHPANEDSTDIDAGADVDRPDAD